MTKRVLIVKLSSMGDIIHTLPALTDAARALPGVRFDWVVEEGFCDIPVWHSAVEDILPVALRRWRRGRLPVREIAGFLKQLRSRHYDAVIDAQGLMKSAVIARLSRGCVHGLSKRLCREPHAHRFYHHTHDVGEGLHAIARTRRLFADTLGYQRPVGLPDYGFRPDQILNEKSQPYLVFIHGTTWATKHWPEAYWVALAKQAGDAGYRVKIPSGISEAEQMRAAKIAAAHDLCEQLPPNSIVDMASVLQAARAVVAVDTGFAHLAAALNVPTVALYGPTDPQKVGTQGAHQAHLIADFACAPCAQEVCNFRGQASQTPACFGTLTPEIVWSKLLSSGASFRDPLQDQE